MIKKYNSLDLMKFICAFLIIILHTAPLSSYSRIISYGLRNIVTVVAVPLFFMCSGFILSKKLCLCTDDKSYNNALKKSSKRIIITYCLWSAIYFVFVVVKWLREGFTYKLVLRYIWEFFFEGSYSTIWFLPALLAAQLLVFLLHKKIPYKNILIISLPIYAITLLGTSYYGLITQRVGVLKRFFDIYYLLFSNMKNGLFFGFIFVALGAFIAELTQVKKPVSLKKSTVCIVIFWGMLAIEQVLSSYFVSRSCDTSLMMIPLCYFIFNLVLNIDLKDSDIYIKMRKYSILMFLCQRIPLSILELYLYDTVLFTNSILFFITVTISTLIISYIIIELSKKFKIFNYLY